MEATAVKTGKRMEQALDKQAQALIQTVKIARTEAFEAELSELNGKFRTNKPFMFQIAAISPRMRASPNSSVELGTRRTRRSRT